jgi:hypothetical protein
MKFWDTEKFVHAEYQDVRKKANRLLEIFLPYLEQFEEETNESIKSIAIGN